MNKLFPFVLLLFLAVSCGGNADNLDVGNDAPDFTLNDAKGNAYTLSANEGKAPVVLYFYPKAGTPGCTKQACGIRDDYSKFLESGIVVYGISVDDTESINSFTDEYELNFPLLSDIDKAVAKKYGVLNNFGVASRVTFIIDKDGKIAHIIRDVDVDTHSNKVYELAKDLI